MFRCNPLGGIRHFKRLLSSLNYDDSDGIIDLELGPSHAGKNTSH
jgi:hypothetical protein